MGKRKGRKAKWLKETLELSDNHRWTSKDGYSVFVAGRGAVRFDVPKAWKFEPGETSFKFTDREPPDDNCRLEASYNHLPDADWRLFPLKVTLKQIMREDSRDVIELGEVMKLPRQTAHIVWGELKFLDRNENREAYSRICVGIGSGVQCLITFDYWVDDAEAMTPIWDVVLESLTLGLYIRDPRTGISFPD
ncbi:MAG: hypothetical protein F6K16_33635 [Symploca sp. SIO2B6]|nr:hypothetical protein [Symploca sp. SIO2B6]